MLLKLIDFPCMLSTMLIPNPEVQSLYHVATYVFDNIFKLVKLHSKSKSAKLQITKNFKEIPKYNCDHHSDSVFIKQRNELLVRNTGSFCHGI